MGGGAGAGVGGLLAHVVDEVVDVEDVAAGEDAGHAGLEALVDERAARGGADAHPGGAGELVLGKEADGEQQRVALDPALGAGDRA